MKIVIAGAGEIGFHLAQLLSYERQNITLIDIDQEVLDYAATHLDVRTMQGDSSMRSVLDRAGAHRSDLVLAMTTSEKTNLLTAMIAKKTGAKQTVARVHNQEYLRTGSLENFKDLGIDSVISPNQLAAKEIKRLIGRGAVTDFFDFDDGLVSLIGLTIKSNSPIANHTIDEVERGSPHIHFRPIAILRKNDALIPEPQMIMRRGDQIFFIVRKAEINEIIKIVGLEEKTIRTVMINGGSDLGYDTAEMLQRDYSVTLIESDEDRCKWLANNLKDVLVVKCSQTKMDQLREEGLENMDAFISVTNETQVNVLTSLLAKNSGVYKTIALVDSMDYTRISQNIGIDTIINKKLIAANNIFRYVRKGKIVAITGLHGLEGEIIEFAVYKESKLTKKPLNKIGLPKNSVIGTIIRGQEVIFPAPDVYLRKDDRVIIFAMPDSISQLEGLFK